MRQKIIQFVTGTTQQLQESYPATMQQRLVLNQTTGQVFWDYNGKRFKVASGQNPIQVDWLQANVDSAAYIKNKPEIKQPVQADWNQQDTEALSYIRNKPQFSGQEQADWQQTDIIQPVQGDWDETQETSLAYIKNKPLIKDQTQSDWAQVDENNAAYIKNKPNIKEPQNADWLQTDQSKLSYIKNKPQLTTPVQGDWNQQDQGNLSYIKNKPEDFIITDDITDNILRVNSNIPPKYIQIQTAIYPVEAQSLTKDQNSYYINVVRYLAYSNKKTIGGNVKIWLR